MSLHIFLALVIFSAYTVFGCQKSQSTVTSDQKNNEQGVVEGSEGTGVLETGENKDYQDPFPKDSETYKPMPLPDPTKRRPKEIIGDPETPVSQIIEKEQKE